MELILIWVFFPVIAALIASSRGRSPAGWFLLGLVLGPFAWAVALLPSLKPPEAPAGSSFSRPPGKISLDNETKKCPQCAEIIKLEALKCRFCGSELDPENVKEEIAAREAKLRRLQQGERQCPICESWEVHQAYIEDGSFGWWCPHCKASIKKLLGK